MNFDVQQHWNDILTRFLFGKHPAFGDFVSCNDTGTLATGLAAGLGDWMDDVLPRLKSSFGANWTTIWDTAPPIRFWIGPSVVGVPVHGIFLTSKDKVGRRYPLWLGVTDNICVPPTDPSHDETIYDHLLDHMLSHATVDAQSLRSGFDLIKGLVPKVGPAFDWNADQDATLWGQRRDGDLSRLFADARTADAQRAQYGRSHWWHPETSTREAGWLAADGLPTPEAVLWLLNDRWKQASPSNGCVPDRFDGETAT